MKFFKFVWLHLSAPCSSFLRLCLSLSLFSLFSLTEIEGYIIHPVKNKWLLKLLSLFCPVCLLDIYPDEFSNPFCPRLHLFPPPPPFTLIPNFSVSFFPHFLSYLLSALFGKIVFLQNVVSFITVQGLIWTTHQRNRFSESDLDDFFFFVVSYKKTRVFFFFYYKKNISNFCKILMWIKNWKKKSAMLKSNRRCLNFFFFFLLFLLTIFYGLIFVKINNYFNAFSEEKKKRNLYLTKTKKFFWEHWMEWIGNHRQGK